MTWQLLYRNEFNLQRDPLEFINIPVLFHQPQIAIAIFGQLSRQSSYSGTIQQQIIGLPVFFRVRGDILSMNFGYQLFAPRYGDNYMLEFIPSSQLLDLQLAVYAPNQPLVQN